MPRPDQIPVCPEGPPARSISRESRDYTIHLITPLFGGGVQTGEPDPSYPIRGTSIRGHLQFWWRATRCAECSDVPDLFRRHAEIWGSTERASPVNVEVLDIKCAPPLPCADYVRRENGTLQLNWMPLFRNTALPYALFPFQGQLAKDKRTIEKKPAHFIKTASFVLRLRFPRALSSEVEAAVWAWVNFGGLGARTRRGCGSLYCEALAPKDAEQLNKWLRAGGAGLPVSKPWPILPPSLLVRPETGEPMEVWSWLIGQLQHFRQGIGFARNPGPGRSLYPEPETIRRITQRRFDKHEPWEDMPDGFPRAAFGLPIVFHFKDEKRGEPRQTLLTPFVDGVALERMASPLILKPLGLKSQKAVPLILCLKTDEARQVELQDENGECLTPRHAVPVQHPSFSLSGSPLHGFTSAGSALDAFLSFAVQQRGFTEVMR